MVEGIPEAILGSRYGEEPVTEVQPEHVGAKVVESIKGHVNVPVLVHDDIELYQQFKVHDPEFFGCKGTNLWVVSARSGTPVKALSQLMDNSGTPVNVADIVAKKQGTYQILFSTSSDGKTNTITLKEDGMTTEKFIQYGTIKSLCDKINAQSKIIDVIFKAEGSGQLAILPYAAVGSGTGGTPGSCGTVKVGTTDGSLADTDAPAAHALALKQLELVKNPEPGVIFTNSVNELVKAKYPAHIETMNDPKRGGWRIGLLPLDPADDLDARVTEANSYDMEAIWTVGHSAYDQDGNLCDSSKIVSAVAGALCASNYNEPCWGGEKKKVLGLNGSPYFSKIAEVLTFEQYEYLNENGVITLTERKYGIGITEAVTTSTDQNSETDSDQGSVVRIKHKALRVGKDAMEEMEGILMGDTYDNDLKKAIMSKEQDLVDDKALIPDPVNGYPAVEVTTVTIPDSETKKGRSKVKIAIHPAPTSRQVEGDLIMR